MDDEAARIATLVAASLGLGANDVTVRERTPLAHQRNQLYDARASGQHFIAKRFARPNRADDAAHCEERALTLLAPYGIAPEPLLHAPAQPSGRAPIVVYRFVEGAMWDRTPPSAAQLAQLAQAWITMHQVPTDGLWTSHAYQLFHGSSPWLRAPLLRYAAWTRRHFPAGGAADAHCLALFRRFRHLIAEVERLDAPLCFSRADPRFANVIQRSADQLAMVDWEDSGLRDPALDVADLLTHPNQEDLLPPAAWQAFLAPYRAAQLPRDPTFDQRLQRYTALFVLFRLVRLLQAGVERAETGALAGWRINMLTPNERLRRLLARGLAWPNDLDENRLAAVKPVTFFPEQPEFGVGEA